MTKNEKRVYIVLTIIMAIFSAVSFIIPFSKNIIFWLAYLFGIISIIMQMIVFRIAFGHEGARSKFYGFPIARIGVIYMIIQIALSIAFMYLGDKCPAWIVLLIFVILLGTTSIGLITTDGVRDEVEYLDQKKAINIECMNNLKSVVYPLSSQVDDVELKEVLKKLSEEFKYSDPVSDASIREIEEELTELVLELQKTVAEMDNIAIKGFCKKISSVLAERNRLCKLNK